MWGVCVCVHFRRLVYVSQVKCVQLSKSHNKYGVGGCRISMGVLQDVDESVDKSC